MYTCNSIYYSQKILFFDQYIRISKDTIYFYPDSIHFSSFVPERAKRRNPDSRTREWWQSTEWLTALLDWLLLETMAYITWGWQNNWHQTNNWRKRVWVWCPPCWCWSRIRKKVYCQKGLYQLSSYFIITYTLYKIY